MTLSGIKYPHSTQEPVGPRSIVEALFWSELEEDEILNKPRAMLGEISDAKKIAEDGRVLPMLGHVCGTEQDPQPLSEQIGKLRSAGIEVLPTNALMTIASALISRKGNIDSSIIEDVFENFLTGF